MASALKRFEIIQNLNLDIMLSFASLKMFKSDQLKSNMDAIGGGTFGSATPQSHFGRVNLPSVFKTRLGVHVDLPRLGCLERWRGKIVSWLIFFAFSSKSHPSVHTQRKFQSLSLIGRELSPQGFCFEGCLKIVMPEVKSGRSQASLALGFN